jgi:phage/plasmid-like protein (TIGR03299 family)
MPAGITTTDSMFSVREMPWHKLGVVLDEAPDGIDDALEKSGLGWEVAQRPIYVAAPPIEDGGIYVPQLESMLREAPDYRMNSRVDTGEQLGIVGKDYTVVQNRDAFRFLDSLIGSEMHFETAGSLHGGRKAWVLARLPEFVEVGGDETGTYIYIANSHDGSMSVTAAVTPVRIVCANTLGIALRRAEKDAQRTYKFRHVGDLQEKFEEARRVLDITVNYEQRFKELGDALAVERFSERRMKTLATKVIKADEADLGDRAKAFRNEAVDQMVAIYRGEGPGGDTRGNSAGTKWTAVNAVGEYADWGRRYTERTDQVGRSFEDTALKQRALELVS